MISKFLGMDSQSAAATEAAAAAAAAVVAVAVAGFAAAEDTVVRMSNLQFAAGAFAAHPTGS